MGRRSRLLPCDWAEWEGVRHLRQVRGDCMAMLKYLGRTWVSGGRGQRRHVLRLL